MQNKLLASVSRDAKNENSVSRGENGVLREFVWFVAVRTIIDKAEKAVGAKHIGQIPRGRTPEPHQI